MEQVSKKGLLDLVTVKEAAHLTGLTENAIRYQIQTGKLTRYENGLGKIRVNKSELIDVALNFEEK